MNFTRALPLWLALALCSALFFTLTLSCDSGDGDGDADGDVDGDADGDSDGDGDGDPIWTTEVVADGNVGHFSSIDVAADGTVGVAHYGYDARDDGLCEEVLGEPPPKTRFPLYYTFLEMGAADWQTEMVAEPIHLSSPAGVSFRYRSDSTPAVAMYGGDPIDVLCSANDVLYGTRDVTGAWTFETAAADSGEAPPTDDEGCNASASTAGYTVGEWPALAHDSGDNPAIVYRDTHFGGMQRDDIARADAELAYREGGWGHEMVDCGAGGGRDNAVVFDSEDRLVVIHRITRDSQSEDRHGLWAHRRQEDGSWLALRLATGQVGIQERSIIAGDDGSVALVYYDPGSQHAWIAELVDSVRFADGGSWIQTELGINNFNEGQNPAIARTADGILAVAYYRCGRTGEESCSPGTDALIFGWQTSTGAWRYETVDEGATAECGTNLSLAFSTDGRAFISYACVHAISSSEFSYELKVAQRRAL